MRSALLAAAVAVLAIPAVALSLATVAGAQSLPQASDVAIAPRSVETNVTAERPTVVALTVEHTGGSPPPLGGPRGFRVSVSGIPDGWAVQVDPTGFDLAPGERQSIKVTILPAVEATARTATLTFRAQIIAQGASEIPEVGPIVDPEAEDSIEIVARRDEALTRDVLERIGAWIWVVLLTGLALAVLAGKLVLDRARKPVALSCSTPQVVAGPGGRVSFPVIVENTARREQTVVLHVSEMPAGWSAFLPMADLPIPADHAQELQLMVVVPKDAPRGTHQPIVVTAAGSIRPSPPTQIRLVVVVGPAPAGGAAPLPDAPGRAPAPAGRKPPRGPSRRTARPRTP